MSGKGLSDGFIPAVQWSAVILPILNEGHALKLPFEGLSMHPLLAGGRDEVMIEAASRKHLKRGDITLFKREDGMHILHRIHHVKDKKYYMLGDAQTWIEGPIEETDMLAVVTSIIRKGKTIECSRFSYRMISELWLCLRPLRPFILNILQRFPWIAKMLNAILLKRKV